MSSSPFTSGSYGKVNEVDQERLQARRKTRKRITIIALSSIVLVATIVGAAVGVTHGSTGKSNSSDPAGTATSISQSIKAVCDTTLYPDSCYPTISAAAKNSSKIDPEQIFKLSIEVAMAELSKVSTHFDRNLEGVNGTMLVSAMNNCRELVGLAIDQLNDTLTYGSNSTLFDAIDDLETWLSAAGTYQETCIDSFDDVTGGGLRSLISGYLKNSTEFTSNSLAIITLISNAVNSFKLRRRLMSHDNYDEFPKWVSPKDRKLLQNANNLKVKADVVVAKDGSGNYGTISDALKLVPEKSKKRFVIYVKKGVYVEQVRVEKKMWNVMMVGDGMNATIVSGRLNFVDGTPTFSSATFAVFGKGFFARDMGFQNTAGPQKHQAVTLMASADESVFYRCQFDAFQDTLYAHAQRQFYKDCTILGTVDFIFGNAAVVFQNCSIFPKVPMLGQQNTITAQGKVDPNQNTGIVIQNCTVRPAGNLSSVNTYLGRPWKPYSTTIFMRSFMDKFIHPTGWLPWTGTTAPDTIYYSEFENFGPGSSTKNRVKWKGLKNITIKQANKFTVTKFINGDKWISSAGFKYASGL